MAEIHYREEGQGIPLVLIHGFCESGEVWNPLVASLSAQARVLRPDLPGFGGSRLQEPVTIDGVASALWRWLDLIGVRAPVIIGHSLGGYVALAMAVQRPIKIRGIGLFHSTALPDSSEKKENRNKVIDFVSKHGVDPFIDTFVPGLFFNPQHPAIPVVDQMCRQTKKETLLAYTSAMRERSGRLDFLKNFERPCLFIAGEKDAIIPLESLQNQAKGVVKGHLVTLADTGHMGMFEASRESQECINSFMNALV